MSPKRFSSESGTSDEGNQVSESMRFHARKLGSFVRGFPHFVFVAPPPPPHYLSVC